MTEGRPNTERADVAPSRARSSALSVALWVFGLATSLFLLGMWGRTVAVDNATIEESARTVIDAEIATERINTWFEEGLATVADIDSDAAHAIAETVESRPEYQHAVDAIISAFVDSLFARQGETTTVDLEEALAPLVPVLVDEFGRRNIPLEESRIEDVLNDAGVVDLDAGEVASMAAVVADARLFLTQVVVMSLLALIVAGSLAVLLAQERFSMVRHLATRVAVAALSYAVVLRLAGWALDPSRGRSPVAGATSVLFASNQSVLGIVAGVSGAISVAGYWVARRQRRGAVGDSADPVDDDTRELASV